VSTPETATSYSVGTGAHSPRVKDQRCEVAANLYLLRSLRMLKTYLHCPISFRGVQRDNISFIFTSCRNLQGNTCKPERVEMTTRVSFVNLVAYLSFVAEFNETGLSCFQRWTRGCPVQ